MSSKKRKSKNKKSSQRSSQKTAQKTLHFPRVNSWQCGHPHSGRNVFADKDTKRESSVDVLGWKTRYEAEKKDKQKLNKRIKSYQSQIKALQISLGKSSSKQAKSMKNIKSTESLNKKLKQLEKELKINKRKLKLANMDMQKTADYYRKQIDKFKAKQDKLLKKNKALNNSKKNKKNKGNDEPVIKYVFVEDIKKVTLRGKGKKAGIRVHFIDGEEAVFNDVDVVIPKTMEDNYSDVLKEVKEDETLLNDETDSNDILNQTDYESMLNILSQELQKRVEDMEKLSEIIFEQKHIFNDILDDDDQSFKMRYNMIQYITEIKSRHTQYNADINDVYDKMRKIDGNDIDMDTKTNEDNENEKEDMDWKENIMDVFGSNNNLWRDLLSNFPIDVVGILGYELNDRIIDLLNVKDVIFQNEEALYDSIDDVIIDISARHKDTFEQWQKTNDTHDMLMKWESIMTEVNQNNDRWRQQIQVDLSLLNANNVTDSDDTVSELQMEASNDIIDDNKNEQTDIMEPEMADTIDHETEVKYDDNIDNNWLFADNVRNQYLESLQVNQHSIHLLNYIGAYLNRIIPTSDELEPKQMEQLYIPILMKSNDPRNIIMACLDGVLFAVLINLVEPDFIDLRAVHLANYVEPIPLTDLQITENMTTVFASIRALDLQLPLWTIEDYLHPNNTVNIILSVVFQLFRGMLNSQINLSSHPELTRLCQNDKQKHEAPNLVWSEWLNKWLLFMKQPKLSLSNSNSNSNSNHTTLKSRKSSNAESNLKNDFDEKKDGPVLTPVLSSTVSVDNIKSDADLIRNILHTTDYHEYLILICCRMHPNFVSETLPQIKNNTDINKNDEAQLLLNCIKDVIGVQTIICIEDIASRNPMLQEILLSDIFCVNNKLEAMNTTEVKRLTSTIMHIMTQKERTIMAWINKFSPTRLHITNLEDSLTDGIIILQILDKLKAGCVNWKHARQKDQIRHKFDRLANCKMVMEISRNKFAFSLVGMGGNDIADGNSKYIHTLLWQIMRYDSTRLLSELQFNGKSVTDKMMLQWANNRVVNYKKYIMSTNNIGNNKLKLITIKSFRDSQLSDSIFFLNLLASIHCEWINYDLIFEIPENTPNKHNNMDAYSKERLLNAKYLVTTIRKLGGEIFVLPCDICNTDSKANSSIFASIMTITVEHSQDDELKLIQNSLK